MSWNEILVLSGLELNHFQGYTDEDCLNSLIAFSKHLNKVPLKDDFKLYNWKPAVDIYYEKFKTYENACYIAGLIDMPLTTQEKIDINIKELIQLANKLNKCPSVEEYESLEHKGLSRRILEINLKLKYNDICRKYIPKYDLNNNMDRTIDEIKMDIQKAYNILGRTPFHYELKKYGITISYSLINRLFKGLSYNQILIKLGFEPTGSTTLAKTKEEMLEDFKLLVDKLGRLPLCYEIDESETTVTYPTYIEHFGSIENVCNVLNLDYIHHSGIGYVLRDKMGNLSLSHVENNISNFLIDNNVNFTKEYPYGNLILGDKRRFDWKIDLGDKEYYIEYFGMYTGKESKSKMINNYNQKVKEKLKTIYKHNLTDQCIFIYPNDIKIKRLEDIFSIFLHN